MDRTLLDAEARAAIRHDLDATLVVEAAAGTGKTTELVARIVSLLASGRARIDEIVAVTFTEKAAGELKLRIREELERARTSTHVEQGFSPADKPVRLIEDALAHLEEAHVSTIHGFCADLLRERPVEARVDPAFEVLTETNAQRLFDRAFDEWFHEQLEAPSDGVRRALRRMPAWSPDGDDEDGPVGRLRKAAWQLQEWRDLRTPWRRDPFDRDAEVRRAMDEVRELADLSARVSWRSDPLFLSLAPVRALAADYRRAHAEPGVEADLDGWEARLVQLCRARDFKTIKTGRKPDYGAGIARRQVLDAHEALKASLEQFTRRAEADLAALLQQDLLACVDRYGELKMRAGALDFLDLLLRARDLVRDCAPVRGAFRQRFKFILVDEFQDTDPLQAEILVLLAGREDSREEPATDSREGPGFSPADWRRVPIRRGALFVVGDPKQSIYRFRRADVGVYQAVCGLLEKQGARRVYLKTNFRSVPDIQHAVNAAFAPAMVRDAVSLQPDYVALAPHRPSVILEDSEPAATASSVGQPATQRDPGAGPKPLALSPQPSLIALPVPDPYGPRNVSAVKIEESLPDAVAAWIDWLVTKSGWKVTERRSGIPELVDVQARHVCILFRRFVKYREDITRSYVDALEARGIPHLLVGGRSFHDREEVETLRAALAAIEWPDDALNVYGTLRGTLFAIGEETLLEYWHTHPRHRFHSFDVPEGLPSRLEPVGEALAFLRTLHAGRNHRPAAETLGRLLEHTRAHVAFVMRPAGERVLANVLQVVELARQYEADGGISFRGFVDALREAADRSEAGEAPVVEEGSDGVRLMTVHKAKGLEFPVVVLADLTCKLNRPDASRYVDQERGICAVPLIGCAPADLLEHGDDEVARDAAEGVRIAYVAATRARDVLVMPGIGDGPWVPWGGGAGWLDTLNAAIYPASPRDAEPAPGCPELGKDTVRTRPMDDPGMRDHTVRAGLHWMAGQSDVPPISRPAESGVAPTSRSAESGVDVTSVGQGFSPADERLQPAAHSLQSESGDPPEPGARSPEPVRYPVVWWSPTALDLDKEPVFGLRREDLISKEVAAAVVAAGRTAYDAWANERSSAIAEGGAPSLQVRTITEFAHAGEWPTGIDELPPVEVIHLPRDGARPTGRRFGTLVHAVLATTPLDADEGTLRGLATLEGRLLAAPAAEIAAAAALAARVLAHPLLAAARDAEQAGRCRREAPATLTLRDGRLLEGVVDLAFEREGEWVVVDFKTDEDPERQIEAYKRQVGMYAVALPSRASAAPRCVVFTM